MGLEAESLIALLRKQESRIAIGTLVYPGLLLSRENGYGEIPDTHALHPPTGAPRRTKESKMKPLPLTALAAILALAACNKAPETTDNAAVNAADALELDNVVADEAPVIEDADEATAVAVPALPKPPAGAPAAETAPLNQATEIEEEIREGRGIQRIRHGDGWAWMRDGRIVRTADRDGRNVAYFRRGEERPFFVQRGEHSFAYDGDRPTRTYDRDGRARAPDADRTREAAEAAREAREQRQRADRARETAGRPDRRDREHGPARDRIDATPSPTPTPTATATPRGPARDRGDRDRSDRPERTRPDRQ